MFNKEQGKKIAKNTLLLYIRTFFVLLINLYCSRVILDVLGIDDYGIYTVVGGVVTMFSILSASLSTAISRYITYALGKEDTRFLQKIFSTSVNIQIIISLLISLLIETGGVWFLNEKMNIPSERLYAANWVLQCSILTFATNLISVPYNAMIIAHERMNAYAYISILEAVLKLSATISLRYLEIDRLIVYALFILIITIIIRIIYGRYCKIKFKECRYSISYDKKLFKEMLKFATWNFIGSSSGILKDHGVNILINIFSGTSVNAARGISMQVNAALSAFNNNFITAINPQITKSFAAKDYIYTNTLVFKGARFSFYLLLLLTLPLLMETDTILLLWLKTVPEHTVNFVRLILIYLLIESLSYTLITLMLATGNIRNYQIIVGGFQLLNFPLSYILLRNGFSAESTIIIAIIIAIVCLFLRLVMLNKMVGLSIISYIRKVICNVTIVGLLSFIFGIIIHYTINNQFLRLIITIIMCTCTTSIIILLCGCSKTERHFIIERIKRLMFKRYFNNDNQ